MTGLLDGAKVRPRTRYFCALSAAIHTGIATRVPAAMICVHCVPTGVTYCVSATVTVWLPAFERMLAKRNSFQENTKQSKAVAAMPGTASGTTMRKKVCT